MLINAWQASRKRISTAFSKQALQKFTGQIYNPAQSDELKAFSAAFGIFVGIIPVWGFQTLIAISLAVVFKLNKALVVIFSQVSFPPLLPVVLWLSYRVGSYYITGPSETSLQNINQHLGQYIYGSLTLAVAGSAVAWLLTFSSLKCIRLVKQYRLGASKIAG